MNKFEKLLKEIEILIETFTAKDKLAKEVLNYEIGKRILNFTTTKCKEQKEICANRAMLIENPKTGEDMIDKKLILNSPLPKL
jgi:hypothetical protein